MPSCNILAISCGSSSIKFALANKAHSLSPLHGPAECLSSRDAVLRWEYGGNSDNLMTPSADHHTVLAQLLPMAQNVMGGRLHGTGHRMVHGGELSTHATRTDDRVIEMIRATAPLAPLHDPVNLQGIEVAMTLFPKLPHVAVFDTAFHQSLPEHTYRYTLSEVLYHEHGVCRYGFHGTSHRYASHRAAKMAGLAVGDSSQLGTHLDNGSSTCTIVNGQSFDTDMDLTPLEGLVIGTHSGDADPNLRSHLARTPDWSLEYIDSILNNESGLLGLSDLPNDMRTLEQERGQGRPGAALAIEVLCYRLAKSLAAMSCTLSQPDRVTFTGGISESSPLVYAKTTTHLRLFDLHLDQEVNARRMRGVAGPIQTAGYPRVLMVPTSEERQIVLDTLTLLD